MAKVANVPARVLMFHPAVGAAPDTLVEGPADAIQQFEAAGFLDTHPDSVAYATAQGHKPVALGNPAAAGELAAAAQEAAEGGAGENPAA